MRACAGRLTMRGNSIWSIPFKMMLYVFIGSAAVNGGLYPAAAVAATAAAVEAESEQISLIHDSNTQKLIHPLDSI